MCPIFTFNCGHCDSQHDSIVDRDCERDPCPKCGEVAPKVPTTFGGYSIRGTNGGSTRPKQSGSFRGKKS